jgi:hypothetical protein
MSLLKQQKRRLVLRDRKILCRRQSARTVPTGSAPLTTRYEVHEKISVREISDSDLYEVERLLAKGFYKRPLKYWRAAIRLMREHSTAPDFPKYGYLLEHQGTSVGVILLISTTIRVGAANSTRCNVSSLYVDPRFRTYATLLSRAKFRAAQAIGENVTYLNISPAPQTRRFIELQGFTCYSNGQFLMCSLPIRRSNLKTRILGASTIPDVPFDSSERDLLLAHAGYSCISLWCQTARDAHPFVFRPRLLKHFIPCVQLIFCREIEDLVKFEGPIGRFLTLRGWPLIVIDANGRIPGLVGKYFDGVSPKYFKGPEQPRLGDLAYTEAAMFGI